MARGPPNGRNRLVPVEKVEGLTCRGRSNRKQQRLEVIRFLGRHARTSVRRLEPPMRARRTRTESSPKRRTRLAVPRGDRHWGMFDEPGKGPPLSCRAEACHSPGTEILAAGDWARIVAGAGREAAAPAAVENNRGLLCADFTASSGARATSSGIDTSRKNRSFRTERTG